MNIMPSKRQKNLIDAMEEYRKLKENIFINMTSIR